MHTNFLSVILKGRNHSVDLSVGGRIILKFMLFIVIYYGIN
jgi:hypothetical protein